VETSLAGSTLDGLLPAIFRRSRERLPQTWRRPPGTPCAPLSSPRGTAAQATSWTGSDATLGSGAGDTPEAGPSAQCLEDAGGTPAVPGGARPSRLCPGTVPRSGAQPSLQEGEEVRCPAMGRRPWTRRCKVPKGRRRKDRGFNPWTTAPHSPSPGGTQAYRRPPSRGYNPAAMPAPFQGLVFSGGSGPGAEAPGFRPASPLGTSLTAPDWIHGSGDPS